MRILLIYGFAPSGHASAARAIETVAVASGHECQRINVSGQFHRFLGPFVAGVYLGTVKRLPGLWQRLYDNERAARVLSYWRWLYRVFFAGRLRRALQRLDPDVVVCTHALPLAALALERERGGFRKPLVAVVTDLRAHRYWFSPNPADLYIAAEDDERLPSGKVAPVGIPIHPVFEDPPTRAQARARLGLAADAEVIVLSGGSRGLGQLAALADALLSRLPRARVLAVCGNNAALARALKRRAKDSDGRLWVYENASPEQVVEVKAAADLLIGKGGGVTIAECLALGLPMLIFEPIPGQERRNADILLARGAAVEADAPEAAAQAAERLFRSSALSEMSEKARAWGRPDAARRAFAAIAELAVKTAS